MGAKQEKIKVSQYPLGQIETLQSRFLKPNLKHSAHFEEIFEVPPFKTISRLIAENISEIDPKRSNYHHKQKMMTTVVYFQDEKEIDLYISTIIKLKQLCECSIYDEFQIIMEEPIAVVTRQNISGRSILLNPSQMKNNILKFVDLLIFLAGKLQKTRNLYIQPKDIQQSENFFYIRTIKHNQYSRKQLLLGYVTWLYQFEEDFQDGINNQNLASSLNDMDLYIREISLALKNNKIADCDLFDYFVRVKERMIYLSYNFDSLHACFNSKKFQSFKQSQKEWVLAKKYNEVYFVNTLDGHVCQGKIVRKKKKINIQKQRIIFDPQELELKFLLDGTKIMVRAAQFQLEDSFSISDIQITHKLPFKLKNPFMFMNKREQIYMLDQIIYRYSLQENKLYQDSKKINDSLFLAESSECKYIIVRLSIDIFRNGIRLYMKDRYETLYPSGNQMLAAEIQSIKIDIKHVQFCFQAFPGVFLMLANRNLWILDINFMCFFSFASLERVKQHCKSSRHHNEQSSQYMFPILNQSFKIKFLQHHDGINVSFVEDKLHIIGLVMGKLCYVQYQLIFEAGMLKLLTFKPLLGDYGEQKISSSLEMNVPERKQYYFNVYNENMEFYKNGHWIQRGCNFLQIYDLRIASCKSGYQVFIECEKTLMSLRDVIQSARRNHQSWKIYQICMLLFKLLSLYECLIKNQITHRNFNIGSLFITQKKQLKMSGWSEPQRNWHASDYKDFILVCFNLITFSTYDKLTDKIWLKHEHELSTYPLLADKIGKSIKGKGVEKRGQGQKNLLVIKEWLGKQLSTKIEEYHSNDIIFSFEFNTPRFSLIKVSEGKIKKLSAILQGASQQFTFKDTDKYAWNQEESKLTIVTANFQMLETRINHQDYNDETVSLEEFQYLPQNIQECAFVYCCSEIYCFGGIMKHGKKKMGFNRKIYKFNRQKLTWEAVAETQQARVNPKLIVSSCKRFIYVMGGQNQMDFNFLSIIRFDSSTNKAQRLTDWGIRNPLEYLFDKNSVKVFQISEQYKIFVVLSINSTSYHLKIFSSLVCGFQTQLDGKIYIQDNSQIQNISVSFSDGAVHFLRPYGKYTRLKLEKLDLVTVTHKTLYNK